MKKNLHGIFGSHLGIDHEGFALLPLMAYAEITMSAPVSGALVAASGFYKIRHQVNNTRSLILTLCGNFSFGYDSYETYLTFQPNSDILITLFSKVVIHL